jgi:membrane associated rhomboid family serine protease/cytochrome c-type biogenesis protein CcmH/NrfG
LVTGPEWVRADELDIFRRLHAPARLRFAQTFTLSQFPYFTLLLCLAQIALFLSLAGPNRFIALDPLIDAGAKVRPNILELGETWRLLTANVLHRDILHLLFNSFFLFNLGGSIENAFRLRDYVWILVVSALFTTGLSTVMSTTPSVGASGMILGLFGAASVFGYKYGSLLPRRYRHYFGSAVLPYAIFILYVGLATTDTDNWGHLGGLMGGLLATLPLQPRLLVEDRDDAGVLARYGSVAATAAVLGLVLGLGPVLRSVGVVFEPIRDARSGIAFVYPSYWESGENHLGYVAKGNALGTSIGVRAETRSSEPYTMREVRTWFVEGELGRLEREGIIAGVVVEEERPFVLPGGRALEIRVRLESRAGAQVTRNIVVERGYYRYAIVFSAPERWSAAYAPLLDRLEEQLSLVEPDALQDARTAAERFSGMTSAHVGLGNELARIGDVDGAREAYERGLITDPSAVEAIYGLAKLASDFGGDLRQAERMASGLLARDPREPAFAALVADLRTRLGMRDEACEALQETFDRLERPPQALRNRVIDLRCFRRN